MSYQTSGTARKTFTRLYVGKQNRAPRAAKSPLLYDLGRCLTIYGRKRACRRLSGSPQTSPRVSGRVSENAGPPCLSLFGITSGSKVGDALERNSITMHEACHVLDVYVQSEGMPMFCTHRHMSHQAWFSVAVWYCIPRRRSCHTPLTM